MPATPLEVTMAAVWQELIDTDDIGLDDNFFDLGGHSLLAMRAVTEIKRRTGLTLHVRRLIFETLGQLAASADKGLSPSAPPQPGAKLTHDGGSGSGQRADKPAEQQVGQQAKGGWLSRLLGR